MKNLNEIFYHFDVSSTKYPAYRFVRYVIRTFIETMLQIIRYFQIPLKLKNKKTLLQQKKSDTLIVVGNGPSLNKMDLSFLSKYDVITANAFYTKAHELNLKPNFHIVEDNLPAYDNRVEISEFDCGALLIPHDLKWMYRKTKAQCISFLFLRSAIKFRLFRIFSFSKNFTQHVHWGGTVIFAALQLAHTLDYRRVILIGVDLSYTIPKDSVINGNIITTLGAGSNHFDGAYFGYGKSWHFPDVDRMQIAFDVAYQELSEKGTELFNAGVDSNLKNIPKISHVDL